MLDAFIDKVVIDPKAPHFYTMAIHWSDPEWGIDELLCYRDASASNRWSKEEEAIVREHYETASMDVLLHLLPKRSFTTIRAKGQDLGIRRKYQRYLGDLPESYCLLDFDIMQHYGLTEDTFRNAK